MGAERGESRFEPDSKNRYQMLMETLPLKGREPASIHVDQDGNLHLGLRDASKLAGLSVQRLRDLIWTERLTARKLGSSATFVDLFSLLDYLDHGRKKGGRPRKNPQA